MSDLLRALYYENLRHENEVKRLKRDHEPKKEIGLTIDARPYNYTPNYIWFNGHRYLKTGVTS